MMHSAKSTDWADKTTERLVSGGGPQLDVAQIRCLVVGDVTVDLVNG